MLGSPCGGQASSGIEAKAPVVEKRDPDPRWLALQKMASGNESLQIWWLRPRDPMWKEFEYIRINKKQNPTLETLLKTAKYDRVAGYAYTLDLPYEACEERGQGFLIVLTEKDRAPVGFCFKGTSENKRALEFITLTSFDPDKKRIECTRGPRLDGVVLDSDFRSILLGPEKDKAAGK